MYLHSIFSAKFLQTVILKIMYRTIIFAVILRKYMYRFKITLLHHNIIYTDSIASIFMFRIQFLRPNWVIFYPVST